jgi:predicted acylesterase/phospholipase RssA
VLYKEQQILMLKNIVFSGGGFYGLMMIGCLRALEERNMLQYIHTIAGCSAGSLLALGLAIGLTSKELAAFAREKLCGNDAIPPNDHSDETILSFDRLVSIVDTYGVSDGEMVIRFARELLMEKLRVEDIDFIELAKRTGKNVVIVGTNVTQGRSEFFCMDKTPHMSVVTAVRISCSLPLLFTPVTMNGDLYIDGGLFNNFPIDYVEFTDTLHQVDTIGFHIRQPPPVITNIATFLAKIVFMVHEKAGNALRDNENICVLNIESAVDTWMSLMDMKLKKEAVDNMIQNGYNIANTYMMSYLTRVVRESFS